MLNVFVQLLSTFLFLVQNGYFKCDPPLCKRRINHSANATACGLVVLCAQGNGFRGQSVYRWLVVQRFGELASGDRRQCVP